MQNIQIIIDKTNKVIELLNELNKANIAEDYRYVMKYEYNMGSERVFSLYDTFTEHLKIDRHSVIQSYCKIRNIKPDQIYFVNN